MDESSGNDLLTDNAADANWIITDETGPGDDNGVNPPQAASAVTQNGGWTAALAGSGYVTRGNSRNGVIGQTYTYTYRFTIDMISFTDFALSGAVLADNQVRILLNGNEILAQTGDIRGQPAVSFNTSDQSFFQDGVNTLSFEVLNTSQNSTGLDATGLVTGTATSVPEPHEWAMIFASGGVIVWWRRKDLGRLAREWQPTTS